MLFPSQGGAKLAADSPQCNMDSKVEANKLKEKQTNIAKGTTDPGVDCFGQ